MDPNKFWSFYEPGSNPSRKASNLKSNNSIVPLLRSTVSDVNKSLLQVMFPSEDTIKTYLDQDQNNDSDSTDCDPSTSTVNLNDKKLCFETRFIPKRPEVGPIYAHDMASASIYSDILYYVVCSLVYNNNLNLSTLGLNGSSEAYDQCYNIYQVSQSNQQFIYHDYVKLRSNTSLLTRLGYQVTITLNTDNDAVQEIWDPNVAQTILSVDYSPLSLKKDFLTATLDPSESLLISKLVNGFQNTEPIEWPDFSLKIPTNPPLAKFVSIAKELESFKKICNHDKIMLLTSAFFEIDSMNVVFTYNQSTDDWICPDYGTRFSRRDLFLWNRLLYDITIPAVETLPDKWRNDEVVKTLISLIIIFNPDLIGLEFPDSIRHEQYIYIHLLKRHLDSVCSSPCAASDNLYRLLVGVEKFRALGEVVCDLIDRLQTGYHRSLRNWISNIIGNDND